MLQDNNENMRFRNKQAPTIEFQKKCVLQIRNTDSNK